MSLVQHHGDAYLEVLSIAERLGHVSHVLTEGERNQIPGFAGAIDRLMDHKIRDLLSEAARSGSPILWVYMSDGWSTDISESRSVKTCVGSTVRVGRIVKAFKR